MISDFDGPLDQARAREGRCDRINILRPHDFHLHIRQGEMLKNVLPYTVSWCEGALIMPNIRPPVLNAGDAIGYLHEIEDALVDIPNRGYFTPHMTIQIVPGTMPGDVRSARYDAEVVAGKVYPKGMTTNSENGVEDYEALFPVFEEMEIHGMTLCLHGEHPGKDVFALDREERFLEILEKIVGRFPSLRVVLEHMTTAAAVERVTALPYNVAATITVHHLMLTLDDVIGHMLKPHYFCKPVAKRPKDRNAVLTAALSGNPKFFLGTDSAPHLRSAKECADGCAGIFTAPVALPLLTTVFEREGKLDRLENFTSLFGPRFYALPESKETVSLVRETWKVPDEIHGIVPFMAGRELPWRIMA